MSSTPRRVKTDEDILNGNPFLDGTQLTVLDIVTDCAFDGLNDFLESENAITFEDLEQVFQYCSSRHCDVDGSHCGGCSLRLDQDNIHNKNDFINRFSEVRFTDSKETISGSGKGIMILPGTASTLDNTWKGEDGWIIARKLLNTLNKK